MRADAKENKARLRNAAAECFREYGLVAPVTEIARRAGVSPGTLYNLYGSRERLIDEVIAESADAEITAVVASAGNRKDAWDKLATFIEGMCELQARDPGICDVLIGRCSGAPLTAAVFDRAQSAAATYVEQARSAGALRSDFATEDLLFILGANALLARATEAVAPGSWRRGVALYLQGLRVATRQPLPAEPLTPDQATEVLSLLPGGRWGAGRPPAGRNPPAR